jgi:hypothetical protein
MNKFLWAETVLKRKDHIAAIAKKNQRSGVRLEANERIDTLQKLADLAGITRDAMYKVKVILAIAAADPNNDELTAQIDALRKDADDITITGLYDELLKTKGKKRTKKSAPSPQPTESPQGLTGQFDRIYTLIEDIAENLSIEERLELYNTLDKWISKTRGELVLSVMK